MANKPKTAKENSLEDLIIQRQKLHDRLSRIGQEIEEEMKRLDSLHEAVLRKSYGAESFCEKFLARLYPFT